MNELRIYLFLSSETPHSLMCVKNTRLALEERVGGQFDLEPVSLLDHPELSEERDIFVTPTLERTSPHPSVKIIADLSSIRSASAAVRLLLNDNEKK